MIKKNLFNNLSGYLISAVIGVLVGFFLISLIRLALILNA